MKTLGVVAFVISCLALWPAISSSEDTKKATLLAQWTSWKDFLEFCEGHNWDGFDCRVAKNKTLHLPPDSDKWIWRRERQSGAPVRVAGQSAAGPGDGLHMFIAMSILSCLILTRLWVARRLRGTRCVAGQAGNDLLVLPYPSITSARLHDAAVRIRRRRHRLGLKYRVKEAFAAATVDETSDEESYLRGSCISKQPARLRRRRVRISQ